MPRKRQGGTRSGNPGVSYTNRSDLNEKPRTQPVRAAPQEVYGQRGQMEAAQAQLPLPGSMGAMDRPTDRPAEPLQAGMPTGPGPGPQALGPMGSSDDDVLMDLRRVYAVAPTDGLRELIERFEERALPG